MFYKKNILKDQANILMFRKPMFGQKQLINEENYEHGYETALAGRHCLMISRNNF